MKNSYWGKVQHESKIERGLTSVSTPRHGGFLVSKGYALKHLSTAAIENGLEWNGYLCYEEDCLASIIFLELPQSRKILSLSVTESDLIRSLSFFNADYLLKRGITPDPEAYKCYLRNQEDNRLRKEKSPDLIVSAITHAPGIVRVLTADNVAHYVTKESYDSREVREVNLLSKCEVVHV